MLSIDMNIYQLIMTIGALILLGAQLIHSDPMERNILYEIVMIIGLLTVIVPPVIWSIEIIRYHV